MTLATATWTNISSSTLSGGGRFGGSCLYSMFNTQGGISNQYGANIIGDCTVEFWTYYTSNRTQGTSYWNGIFGQWSNASSTTAATAAGQISFMYSSNQTICAVNGKELFPSGTSTRWTDGLAIGWHHIAIVRLGTGWTVYVDGTPQLVNNTADSVTTSLASSGYLFHADTQYYNGLRWSSDLRVSNIARYTAAFTPPTAPYGTPDAHTITQLSTNQSYDSFDATYQNLWSIVGNVQLDTNVKFGSQALLFDGSTGYLRTPIGPDWRWLGGPWTVDIWVNAKAPMLGGFLGFERNGGNVPFALGLSSNGQISGTATGYVLGAGFYNNSDWTYITDGTTALVPNTWNHVEVGYDGTTAYLFLNGALLKSGAITALDLVYNDAASSHFLMGRRWDTYGTPFFQGWMQEFCVTKGVCRHTAAFTAPTAPYDLTTDPYASSIVNLVHGTQLPSTQPLVLTDSSPPYGSNWTTMALSDLGPIYQTGKIWTIVQGLNDVDVDMPLIARGNARYVQDLDDTRTSYQIQTNPLSYGGFINGICVVQGNPLTRVNLDLARDKDYNTIARATTGPDGTFTFHNLQLDVLPGFYLIGANPNPSILNENAMVYKTVDATPYAISTTGSFTYQTGTTTVDSTVNVVGNVAPFTVTVVNGSLPPGASITANERAITITGATELTGDYIFDLLIAGSMRNFSSTVHFELTPSGVVGMGSTIGAYGDQVWIEDNSNLIISIDLCDTTSSSPFAPTIKGLPSFNTSNSPTISATQHVIGTGALSLNGSNQFIYSASSITYPTGACTIEGWIFMNALKSYNILINGYNQQGFQISIPSTGLWYFWNGSTSLSASTALAANTWYHLAFTRDANNNYNLWSNGNSVGSGTFSGVLNVNGTSGQISIGHDSANNYTNGYISGVQVWNTCLYHDTFTPPNAPYNPNLIVPLYP